MSRGGASRLWSLMILSSLPCWSTGASAQSFRAFLEPGYSSIDQSSTLLETGERTRTRSEQLRQRYRLTLDRTLYPYLRINGGALYEKQESLSSQGYAAELLDTEKNNLFGHLILGNPLLSFNAGYARYEQLNSLSVAERRLDRVNETATASAHYRPEGFPKVNLFFTHLRQADEERIFADRTSNELQLMAIYDTPKEVDATYLLRYSNPTNHLTDTEIRTLTQAARLTYADTFFDNRVRTLVNYNLNSTESQVLDAGSGTLETQVFPVAGLSAVETFPAVPERVTLEDNPALIDGNLAAGAGINLGYSASAAGEILPRDIGAELADTVTEINALYVHVDRELPAPVSDTFTWMAYASDDNLDWTQLTVNGPVQYDPFLNRFEIPLQPTAARFVKVVTTPLPTGATTDPGFADIFVTEIQLLVVRAAEQARRTESAFVTSTVNATLRSRLLADEELYHDFSARLTQQHEPRSRTTYFLNNGLSYQRRLSEIFTVSGRFARFDSDGGRGHEGSFLYTSTLNAVPLPTLRHSLIYTGQQFDRVSGSGFVNTFHLFNRAEIYRGVSATAAFSFNFGQNERDQNTRGGSVTLNTSVSPHRALSLSAGYIYDNTLTTGGDQPAARGTGQRLYGSASFSPVRALYLSAGLTYTERTGAKTRLLGNYGINVSPFPDGNLQLRASYTENLDPLQDAVTRMAVGSLRWNIRRGTYLDATYSRLVSQSDAFRSKSGVFGATLTVVL